MTTHQPQQDHTSDGLVPMASLATTRFTGPLRYQLLEEGIVIRATMLPGRARRIPYPT